MRKRYERGRLLHVLFHMKRGSHFLHFLPDFWKYYETSVAFSHCTPFSIWGVFLILPKTTQRQRGEIILCLVDFEWLCVFSTKEEGKLKLPSCNNNPLFVVSVRVTFRNVGESSFQRFYFPSLREIGKEVTSQPESPSVMTLVFIRKRPPVSETKWERGFDSLFIILCFDFSLERHQHADRLTTDMTRRRVKTRPPWVSCRIIFFSQRGREDWESVFSPFLSWYFLPCHDRFVRLSHLSSSQAAGKEETVNRPSSQKVWGLCHRSLWSLLFFSSR